jgi:hypothetical protein
MYERRTHFENVYSFTPHHSFYVVCVEENSFLTFFNPLFQFLLHM